MTSPAYRSCKEAIRKGFEDKAFAMLEQHRETMTKGEIKRVENAHLGDAPVLVSEVRALLETARSPSNTPDIMIDVCCEGGNYGPLKILIKNNYFEPDEIDYGAEIAYKEGHRNIVKMILRLCKDVPLSNLFELAVNNNDFEIVAKIIRSGQYDDLDYCKALRTSIRRRYNDIIQLLLSCYDFSDDMCRCPSDWDCGWGHQYVARLRILREIYSSSALEK